MGGKRAINWFFQKLCKIISFPYYLEASENLFFQINEFNGFELLFAGFLPVTRHLFMPCFYQNNIMIIRQLQNKTANSKI